jgi:Putative prokaryotic signal transducing protein
MKKVYSAATLIEAHLVRDLLRHAGIDAQVLNENLQSIMGEIPVNHAGPEVWVLDQGELSQALEVVRRMQRPVGTQAAIFCGECHEENPRNFELCWKCLAELQAGA